MNRNHRHWLTRAAVAATSLSLAAALAGCGQEPSGGPDGGSDLPEDLATLIEAAKQEGEVTFYGSLSEPIVAALAEGFQEEFGIAVNWLRLTTVDLESRYANELQAGAPTADVIVISHGDKFPLALIEDGLMVDPKDAGIPALDDYPAELFQDGAAIVGSEAWGFAYNTDLVDEADVPDDWTGLANPKWRGQILVIDPSTSAGTALGYLTLQEEYGEEFIEGLAANIYRLTPGMIPNFEALAAGEASLGIGSLASVALPLGKNGAPVKHVAMDFAPLYEHSLGLAAEPAHPNAALLFAHWLMVGEGQNIMNDPDQWGRSSPVTGRNMPAQGVRMDDALLEKKDALFEIMGVG